MKVSHYQLHMWEENCISGKSGSGTIFFSGCTLACVYCQNKKISRGRNGKDYTPQELADLMFELEEMNANNINLVTPDLFFYEIKDAIEIAKNRGLKIPIIFNVSGYENADIIKQFDGLVDIYLTDFKYWDDELAWRYSRGKNYREVAKKALAEMVRQHPQAEIGEDGLMKKGVIVRQLLLPSHRLDAEKILEYLHATYGDKIFISLMSQYTPSEIPKEFPELGRRVTKREYERFIGKALELGITNAFIQEGDVAKESFIPDFS